MSNEIGRLFQRIGDIQGTSTCFFIRSQEIPKESKFIYFHIICNIRPRRKIRTVFGSLWWEIDSPLTYQSPPQHPISSPQNCIVTSLYRTQASGTLCLTSRTFYLNNIMAKHEYYKIAISLIPQELIYE